MIINNDYTIEQYPAENRIVISLPQTQEHEEKLLTDAQLGALLLVVQELMRGTT